MSLSILSMLICLIFHFSLPHLWINSGLNWSEWICRFLKPFIRKNNRKIPFSLRLFSNDQFTKVTLCLSIIKQMNWQNISL